MNKTKKCLVIAACALLLCGCGKETPKLSDGSEAVVTFSEGTENISANELYTKLKSQYALDSLITMIDKEILEKEYPNDLESAKKTAESTLKSMEDTYGKDQIISYFGSVDAYKDTLYLNALRDKAELDYAKSLVTDKEIQSYYDKNIYGDVTVDHILIKTGVTDSTSSDDKTKLENAAKDKINEIIDKLNKAEDKLATFKELAKEYSQDDATKDNGGSLGAINTGTLSSSYDELLKSARNLKDGTYSTSLITTELGYHVIFRESSSEKPSLDSKKDEIKETLGKQKETNDTTIAITALDKLRKKYGMNFEDTDLKTKYANYIANQITNAKSSSSSK